MSFTPYEGKEPYVFISYSRADQALMLSTAELLRRDSCRLWYDYGIAAGAVWPKYIETHLISSGAVLFFMSAGTSVSPNCFSELKTALERKIPVMCIPVDECARMLLEAAENKEENCLTIELAEKYEALTSELAAKRKNRDRENIPKASEWIELISAAEISGGLTVVEASSDPERQKELTLGAGLITDKFYGDYPDNNGGGGGKNGWIAALILSLLLLIASAAATWGLMNGAFPDLLPQTGTEDTAEPSSTPTPAPSVSIPPILSSAVSFPDTLQEMGIRRATGIYEGEIPKENLKGVTELHFCGTLVTDSTSEPYLKDGRWYVNSAPVGKGQISDLSLIGEMYYLEALTLIYQQTESITELRKLPLLKALNVSGSPVKLENDMSGFIGLEELNISHTEISDLTPLSRLKALKTVYVSADMFPMQLDEGAQYEVVLVK